MPDYRRNYVPGGTYFSTLVTHERRYLFAEPANRTLLRSAIMKIQKDRPFTIVAIVLLQDHLHCIWTLPDGDADYSTRLRRIKEEFTQSFLAAGGTEGTTSLSRLRSGERAVWQRRFWEHTCMDQDDLNRCIDYVHWNPVKHGFVTHVRDFRWSSFHRYVDQGIYPLHWGGENPCPGYDEPEWE